MRNVITASILCATVIVANGALHQEPKSNTFASVRTNASSRNFEVERIGLALPTYHAIIEEANNCFGIEISEQTISQLEEIALRAEFGSELVSTVVNASYGKGSSSFDDMSKARAPWEEKSQELKSIMSQAYFNLGVKHREAGNLVESFFYFKDAYDYGPVGSVDYVDPKLRNKAETQLKELLQLQDLPSLILDG
jgi:hypothetical protein